MSGRFRLHFGKRLLQQRRFEVTGSIDGQSLLVEQIARPGLDQDDHSLQYRDDRS